MMLTLTDRLEMLRADADTCEKLLGRYTEPGYPYKFTVPERRQTAALLADINAAVKKMLDTIIVLTD